MSKLVTRDGVSFVVASASENLAIVIVSVRKDSGMAVLSVAKLSSAPLFSLGGEDEEEVWYSLVCDVMPRTALTTAEEGSHELLFERTFEIC